MQDIFWSSDHIYGIRRKAYIIHRRLVIKYAAGVHSPIHSLAFGDHDQGHNISSGEDQDSHIWAILPLFPHFMHISTALLTLLKEKERYSDWVE